MANMDESDEIQLKELATKVFYNNHVQILETFEQFKKNKQLHTMLRYERTKLLLDMPALSGSPILLKKKHIQLTKLKQTVQTNLPALMLRTWSSFVTFEQQMCALMDIKCPAGEERDYSEGYFWARAHAPMLELPDMIREVCIERPEVARSFSDACAERGLKLPSTITDAVEAAKRDTPLMLSPLTARRAEREVYRPAPSTPTHKGDTPVGGD
eukprot:gnl/Dysnectes_brevis/5475_a7892_677.p1 GENE.gnl/Dysnectes_brevis/5475_a7892_677~~gnl/Dysnectes_brevis/5475_a7892_677.p1  ORF type:complete len:221 (+),score=33.92 gnl/Dysnectes_brevis/5475_a7892_677:27-665(+)